jgi:hypothetical protein
LIGKLISSTEEFRCFGGEEKHEIDITITASDTIRQRPLEEGNPFAVNSPDKEKT